MKRFYLALVVLAIRALALGGMSVRLLAAVAGRPRRFRTYGS